MHLQQLLMTCCIPPAWPIACDGSTACHGLSTHCRHACPCIYRLASTSPPPPPPPQQTKVYHHSCYNAHEAHNKLMKSKEKVEGARSSTQRRKKALEKEAEVYTYM